MKKNKGGVVKIVVIAVAVFVLAFAFFSLTNSTGKVTGNQIANSDVGSTGTTNFGSLDVTSFTALLKGEKYTCNKEDVSSEATVSCSGDSGCPPTARCVFGSGGSGGICAYCLDSEGNQGDWVGSQCQGGDLIPMQA